MKGAQLSCRKLGEFMNDPKFYGRMPEADFVSSVTGPCGDTMEFYAVIREEKIEQVKYYAEGCAATRACGAVVAYLATGETVLDALSISPAEILGYLQGLPEDHHHCAILSVTAFFRTVADYLLKRSLGKL